MANTVNAEFETYYDKIYGSRWPALRESLLRPSAPVPYTAGLAKPYMLDYASVLAAKSLRLSGANNAVDAGGEILDACAAPGGKTLVIASAMGGGMRLLANELSAERRRRLADVLDAHLDREKREQVRVSGFDAAVQGGRKSEQGRYAAILLDAPCSSERHVIQSEKYLPEWTPARPRFLARRQWALLSSAFLLLESGGSLVYATCALSPEENDALAARLLKKYKGAAVIDAPDFTEGEKTEFGRIILPDVCQGMGPMYVARFTRILSTDYTEKTTDYTE
ncbi:SAM-dependent methyltransferase [Spirochaetia bacterium]|nr:SAM-dependent methyltransferase [Spirochaetia bacterium]